MDDGQEVLLDGSAAPSNVVAEVRDLHVTFRRREAEVFAVRGVDLTLARGEILGLVGESGSGKSVLGLSLLGLLPSSPAPKVRGQRDRARCRHDARRRDTRRAVRRDHLGAVFQDPMTSLNPTMRVGRQVAEAAGSGAAALELLEAVGIPEPARRMREYPARALGRAAPTRDDRDGDRREAFARRRRRADDRARRHGAGTDPRARSATCATRSVAHSCSSPTTSASRRRWPTASRSCTRAGSPSSGRPSRCCRTRPIRTRAGCCDPACGCTRTAGRPLPSLLGDPPDPRDPLEGCAFAPRCPLATDECTDRAAGRSHAGRRARRWRACTPTSGRRRRLAAQPGLEWPTVMSTAQRPLAVSVGDVHKTFVLRAGFRKTAAARGAARRQSVGSRRRFVALVGESGCGKSTLLARDRGLDADRRR